MTNLRALVLALCALLLAACEEKTVSATQLLIEVKSDLGDEIASVEARTFDAAEQKGGPTQVFSAKPPFSFAVVPASKDPDSTVLVVVTAKDAAGNVLAVSKTLVMFVPNKSIQIDVRLLGICRGIQCGQGQTCVASVSGSAECMTTPMIEGHEATPGGDGGSEPIGQTMGTAIGEDGGGPGGTTSMGGTTAGGTTAGGTASMGGTTAGGTTAGGTTAGGSTTGGTTAGGTTAGGTTAGGSTAGGTTAGGTPAGVDAGMDAGMMGTPDSGPPPECDQTHPCSAGYTCTATKCVSMCATTTCDPNANCALVSGKATCTCKSGFTAAPSTGGAVMCLMNQTCAAAGCDSNAACTLNAQNQAVCTCNPGYTGTGKLCTPVSCPALTIDNGTVNAGTGTYLATATYMCSTGYEKTGGSTRRCEVNGTWSGSAPTCAPHDCLAPPPPPYGTVTATGGTKLNATARYMCPSPLGLTPATAMTRTCTATGWSGSTPACVGCGDTEVQSANGEECDWANPITNVWTCTSDCKRVPGKLYLACVNQPDCGSGQDCLFGVCSTQCPSGGLCPQLSSRAPGQGTCGGMGFGCLVSCSRTTQCPPGNVCDASLGFCVGCRSDGSTPACPSGQTCVGIGEFDGRGTCR